MLKSAYEARGHSVTLWSPRAVLFNWLPRSRFAKWGGYIDQYLLFPLMVRKALRRIPTDTLFVFCDQALGPWVPLVRGRPHVVHVHDLLALRSALGDVPENRTGITGRIYQRYIRRGFRQARHFICTSKKTREDLRRFGAISGSSVEVVYNGLNHPYVPMTPEEAHAVLREAGLPVPAAGMVLHVGGGQWYKNQKGVILIYAHYAAHCAGSQSRPLPLWCISPQPNDALRRTLASVPPNGQVQYFQKLDARTLQAAYSIARVLLFPSLAEGFGWPLIEAQACGCPVITTDEPPMNEVAGDTAHYLPRLRQGSDIDAWAANGAVVLRALLDQDPARRLSESERGRAWVERFDADGAIDRYLAIYARVLDARAIELPHTQRGLMRILHILSSVDPRAGGPMEGVRQRGLRLTHLGHSVEVVTLDDPTEDFLKAFPLKAHALGPSHGSYAYNARLVPWLKAHARDYDAVIIHGVWQYHSFGAWCALHKIGVPYYVFTHGMLDPWFKHAYPLKHLKKWLYWPWADYRVLRDARAVLFTSEEERLQARRSFWLYRAREQVVSYGTSAPPQDSLPLRERFLAAHPELRGRRILLFLGRVHEKKGCDLLIRAFAEVASAEPALHLLIAGPDHSGWAARLQHMARELSVAERISWPGMLQADMKWGAFYSAEAFVLPSHQENFGIAVAEALGCGVPALISDKVNIWREVRSHGAGLVESDTVQGTLRLLRGWLDLSSEEREVMGERARELYRTRFTVNAMAQSLLDVVQGHDLGAAVAGRA